MKAILTLIKIDVTNGLRDSLIVYILLAPILLSFGLRAFIPSFEQANPPLVVYGPQEFWDSELRGQFKTRFDIARATNLEDLNNQVLRRDSRVGIIFQLLETTSDSSGDIQQFSSQIVFQGTEKNEYRELIHLLVLSALGDLDVASDTKGPSALFQYATVILSMMGSLIGGLAVAFIMIEEKEQNITRCYAITPVTSGVYYGARGITAGTLGIVLALVGHGIITGFNYRLEVYVVTLLASVPLALVIALLVGGIARNQIQGIAVLKIVMAIFLTVPLVSIFLPETLQPIFYIFPNYWMFKALESVYVTQPVLVGPGFLGQLGWIYQVMITLGLGAFVAGVLIAIQGKELKPGWK